MAFCSKCGAQLEGNERFCVKCGADLGVRAAGAPAPVAGPPPAAPAAPAPQAYMAPGPPAAPPPPGYGAPGPIPVVMPPQTKSHGWVWGVIIVLGVLYGLYYIGTHNPQPGTNPQPAPTQPGGNPQPGGAPGPAAPVQPGDPGPGGPNDALVQQQSFNGSWRVANGDVQIYNAQWANRSNVTLQSASLECDQYDQNGTVLSQQRITLWGVNRAPVQPGTAVTFNQFDGGQAVQGLSKVNCGIVAVTPAQ